MAMLIQTLVCQGETYAGLKQNQYLQHLAVEKVW